MAHAQKPDFVFRRNGRVHLNRHGASVQSTIGSRGVLISGSNAGYTMFRGSVKSTGYPLHSPVSPSLPLPCVTVCHHISTGLYLPCALWIWCKKAAISKPWYWETLTASSALHFSTHLVESSSRQTSIWVYEHSYLSFRNSFGFRLDPENGRSDWSLSRFSSLLPGKYRFSARSSTVVTYSISFPVHTPA